MEVIKDQKFGGERPLFAQHDLRLENVTITEMVPISRTVTLRWVHAQPSGTPTIW